MKKTPTLADIRAVHDQLVKTSILKGNLVGFCVPKLHDGIVHLGGFNMMHPAAFLDMFGEKRFLALKSDISKARMRRFVKDWKTKMMAKAAFHG